MADSEPRVRVIAQNKKARYLYLILEELECGIVLQGTEVKSLRAGQGSLQEAYCRIKRGELWLVGMHLPEYKQGNVHNHLPTRDRKLLARSREIHKWGKAVRERGVTIVPLEIYFKGSLVKVKVALVKGKKLHDKRETQRERSAKREIDRAMSRRR